MVFEADIRRIDPERDDIVGDFTNAAAYNYDMKAVFTDVAAYCKGG